MIANDARIYGQVSVNRADEMHKGSQVLNLPGGGPSATVDHVSIAEPAIEATVLTLETDGRSVQVTPDQAIAIVAGIGEPRGATIEFVRADALSDGDQVLLAARPCRGCKAFPPESAWAAGVLLAGARIDTQTRRTEVRVPDSIVERLVLALNGIDDVHAVRWNAGVVGSESPRLYEICEREGLGLPPRGRRIAENLGYLYGDSKRAYLKGFRDGTRTVDEPEAADDFAYVGRSRDLMLDLRAVHVGMGEWVGPLTESKTANGERQYGFIARRFQLAGNLDDLAMATPFQHLQGMGEWATQPIKRIAPGTTTEVVKLGVDAGDTLIADGFVLRVDQEPILWVRTVPPDMFHA